MCAARWLTQDVHSCLLVLECDQRLKAAIEPPIEIDFLSNAVLDAHRCLPSALLDGPATEGMQRAEQLLQEVHLLVAVMEDALGGKTGLDELEFALVRSQEMQLVMDVIPKAERRYKELWDQARVRMVLCRQHDAVCTAAHS